MNDSSKSDFVDWKQLVDLLINSVENGGIPAEHRAAVEALADAEKRGVLHALNALSLLPRDEPLNAVYALLAQQRTRYLPILLTNSPSEEMSFDTYVKSDVNSLPLSLANSLVEGPSNIDILFLYGNSGQGKTHLLSAIANAIGESALFTNATDLGMELSRARQMGATPELLHWIYQFRVIMLDDFESVSGQEQLQKDILHILRDTTVRNIPVVISSTRKLSRLPGINAQLSELITHGVTAELKLPEQSQLRVIATNRTGNANFPDEVLDYLTKNITDNVHHMVGAIKQIMVLSRQTDTPISIDLARAVAPMEIDLQSNMPNLTPTLENVLAANVLGGNEESISEEQQKKAEMFKDMLASAQDEEEQCLALQIALSERIKELRSLGDTEEIGRLKTALNHLRAGKIREALNCTTF